MIETKEQYEEWQTNREAIGQEYIVETIEALREVVRAVYEVTEAAKIVDRRKAVKLYSALDALPDWLKGE